MRSSLEATVRRRARRRCEYCHLPEAVSETPFQIDHIIADKHGGQTVLANLALSCFYCNSYKGPNISGIDPDTGAMERLFHPRQDRWSVHFRWQGALLVGLTPTGRTTIRVLEINHPDAVGKREALIAEGIYHKSRRN